MPASPPRSPGGGRRAGSRRGLSSSRPFSRRSRRLAQGGLADARRRLGPVRRKPRSRSVARAEAGESLRLTSDSQSAKQASCSKIPRIRACHRRLRDTTSPPARPRIRSSRPFSRRSRRLAQSGLADARRRLGPVRRKPRSRSVARAEAGESLRLTSDSQSAKQASCSKIPRIRACHRRLRDTTSPPARPRIRSSRPFSRRSRRLAQGGLAWAGCRPRG
jgi:transcription elongation GreA/GreB family factor